MRNRRFTRLTDSFNKRIEYHKAALGLTFFYYNFCRKHSTLKGKTPAMAAGIATTVWSARGMFFAAGPGGGDLPPRGKGESTPPHIPSRNCPAPSRSKHPPPPLASLVPPK